MPPKTHPDPPDRPSPTLTLYNRQTFASEDIFDGPVNPAPEVEGLWEVADSQFVMDPNDFEEDLTVPYMKEYGGWVMVLFNRVWNEEYIDFRRRQSQYHTFVYRGIEVLNSVNHQVVKSVIEGSLPRVVLGSRAEVAEGRLAARIAIKQYDQEWRESFRTGQYQPVIYGQYLTNTRGLAPREREVSAILDYAEQYCNTQHPESVAVARRVDMAVNPQGDLAWESGKRRYVEDEEALGRVREFVARARTMLPAQPGDERQKRPFARFGLTNNAKAMFEAYANHHGSNAYIMNLVEAICAAHLPQYSIQNFVICKVWKLDQALAGQILFGRIGSGYISSGFGLGHSPAALHDDDAKKLGIHDWDGYARKAVRFTPYKANHQIQKRAMQEYKKKRVMVSLTSVVDVRKELEESLDKINTCDDEEKRSHTESALKCADAEEMLWTAIAEDECRSRAALFGG